MKDPYSLFKKHVLPNGLTIHHATWGGEGWQSMGFIVQAGLRHDEVGKEGTAHFLEHCVSQSTTKDLDQFMLDLNDVGGGMNLGTTTHNNTSYTFSAPIEGSYFKEALNSFGEMLVGLKEFKNVERERNIILSEFLRAYPLQSRFKMYQKIRQALFPGFWLERSLSPIGRKETITKITTDDLMNFYNCYYIPQNITIVSLGGLTYKQLEKYILNSPFSISKEGIVTPFPEPTEPPKIKTRRIFESSRKLYGDKSKTRSSEISFITTLHGKINIPILRIAEEMLYFDLFEKIRQKNGLAYHVDIERFRLINFSELSVVFEGIKRGNEKKIERIFNQSLKELSKNEALFKRFRKKYSNRDLIPDYSPFTIRKGAMSDISYEGKITSQAHDRKLGKAVKFEDVKKVFEAFEPENRLTHIITP